MFMNIVERYSNDQFNNSQSHSQIPYTRTDDNQFIDTVEAAGYLLIIRWVFRRMMNRGHYASGFILLISSVAAFLVLINSDYGDNSFMVWCFWSLFAVAFVSLAKAIS